MAGRKKAGNSHRKAKFQNQPTKTAKNKKARWERCYKKMLKKADARGVDISPKFTSYEEELKDNEKRNGVKKSRK